MLRIFPYLLLFFLPVIESISYSTGLFILFISGICFSLLFLTENDYYDLKLVIGSSLMIIIFMVSSFFSISPLLSFTESARYACYFIILNYFALSKNKITIIRQFFIPSILVNSLILLLLWFLTSSNIYRFPSEHMSLFRTVYGHNSISGILIYAIPLLIFVSCMVSNIIAKRTLIVLLAIFTLGFVLSLARAGLFALSFSLMLIALFGKTIPNVVKYYISVICLIFVSALLIIFLFSDIFNRKISFDLKRHYEKSLKNEQRFIFWQYAINGLARSPLIGNGLDTYRYIFNRFATPDRSLSTYAHNHYLELFSDSGFLGGTLFQALIIYILGKIIIYHPLSFDKKYYYPLLIGLISSIFTSLLDYDWHFLSLFLYFWIACGLLLPVSNNHKYFILKTKWSYITLLIIAIVSGLSFQLYSSNINKQVQASIDKNNLSEIIRLMERKYNIDCSNIDVTRALGFYTDQSGSTDTHLWYQRTISLNPYLSVNELKLNYLAYLEELSRVSLRGDKEGLRKVYEDMHTKYRYIYPDKLLFSDITKDESSIQKYLNNRKNLDQFFTSVSIINKSLSAFNNNQDSPFPCVQIKLISH